LHFIALGAHGVHETVAVIDPAGLGLSFGIEGLVHEVWPFELAEVIASDSSAHESDPDVRAEESATAECFAEFAVAFPAEVL